uniref:ATP synthase complex subunit 8 n=1 Tax=Hypochilus thorelli TaxID=139869 RepID=B2CKT4_HYPTH|nr:ATP synthase F0 subunit 8 [Hypochilus thorelli]ACA62646.1 ATP synthase subunit 8 [Hypochilus thorelli]
MPQLSPLMWVFSFLMILFFLFGLILLESNFKHTDKNVSSSLNKSFVALKW